jgi:XRE family transcriptional regulator, aerobic/anaerobic benzoate catabolism transcriptional regulator
MTSVVPMDQTEISTIISRQVRRARAAAALTRKELAARAAVSERYLSQLESGEANVSIGILARVAGALGTDMISFLREDAVAPAVAAPLERLLATLSLVEQSELVPLIERAIMERRRALKGIALLGLRGAGKSSIGAAYAARHGLRFVSITREVETRAGMALNELFNLAGQESYRMLENDVIAELTRCDGRVVVETSGGIVGNPDAMDLIFTHFRTIWLRASPEEHLQRVVGQGDLRPMAGNPRALEQLKVLLQQREADYARAEATLVTSGKTVDACVAELSMIAAPVFAA